MARRAALQPVAFSPASLIPITVCFSCRSSGASKGHKATTSTHVYTTLECCCLRSQGIASHEEKKRSVCILASHLTSLEVSETEQVVDPKELAEIVGFEFTRKCSFNNIERTGGT
jgi:hypothetical protein